MNDSRRRLALEQELDRIVPLIRDRYKPEKIIAFGSLVQNKVGPWSDLDLAIIKHTSKRFIDRLIEVGRIADNKLAVDFVVYTPDEFVEMTKGNYFVRDEIVGKGRVVYDKSKAS